MKGMVFTEFIEMVEQTFGVEVADDIITTSGLPSGGAYTSVGNYDHREMLSMVGALSAQTGVPLPDLTRAFGRYLFGRFSTLYPAFFEGVTNAFDMLERIDGYIHVEVRKLYSDAELPRITMKQAADGGARLVYRSARPFAGVAEGLILGCIEHFGENITIQRDAGADDGTQAEWVLTRVPQPA